MAGGSLAGKRGVLEPGSAPATIPRPMASTEPEPKPLSGAVQFEEWDFAALSPAHERDPEWNERRLNARRRLLTLITLL